MSIRQWKWNHSCALIIGHLVCPPRNWKSIYEVRTYTDKMMAIYRLSKSDRKVYDQLIADDVVGRQTVILKDSSPFIPNSDDLLIVYEGSEEAFKRLEQTFGSGLKRLDKREEERVYRDIKDEDSRAEGGMGFLFR